ncbi:hypothetical protein ABEB36_011904 [Hypothenemus hampei]|uniref:Mff-like domain-containing protein n=1 Tax=Hypothenemus hampei TaxID=57062 RepID=A0ABD1E9F1_HYPHA
MKMSCDCSEIFDYYDDLRLVSGTRALPREIAFDNSLLASEPFPTGLPRVATPPRTLTLDKYPFPVNFQHDQDSEEEEVTEEDRLPVVKPNKTSKVQLNLNDSIYSMSNSLREGTPPLDGLTPAEEVVHLRRQMAKLNKRVMALELENLNRLQKEKIIAGFGIAYFLLKIVIWMSRD